MDAGYKVAALFLAGAGCVFSLRGFAFAIASIISKDRGAAMQAIYNSIAGIAFTLLSILFMG